MMVKQKEMVTQMDMQMAIKMGIQMDTQMELTAIGNLLEIIKSGSRHFFSKIMFKANDDILCQQTTN